MNNLATADFSDALTNTYDSELLINELKQYSSVNYSFLSTLTLDQLRMVKDLEVTCSKNEAQAAAKARALLKNYPWPAGLSCEAMNYDLFTEHFAKGVSGETAFYYYVFDKCIERRHRNVNKLFMNRLATFAKASFRELWEESQQWTINDTQVTLEPNKESSKKAALLPQAGEYAADHIVVYVRPDGTKTVAEVEEKPCFSVSGAIEKYRDPKTRYGAAYLMMYLANSDGTYKAGFYIHNYITGLTSEMIPESKFPGYPDALKYVD
jgi:hypothetical protein